MKLFCEYTVRLLTMFRPAFVFLSFSTFFPEFSSTHSLLDGRIVGGWPASIKDYPYVVSIEMSTMGRYSQFCAASIIGHSWVLTAAHCVNGISLHRLRLRSGSSFRESRGEIHNVSEVFPHPKFVKGHENDIAIVKVSKSFQYSDVVQPIKLAQSTPSVGTSVVVIGWGSLTFGGIKPHQLRQVVVNIMDPHVCYQRYSGRHKITDHMLCANVPSGGKDACQGDSGGPLQVHGELAGIVSWGGVCGDKYYPGVYTNVAYFRPWVTSMTGILNTQN